MNNIYWIGTRESDIEDIRDCFAGSVTIFGNNSNGNISYCTNKNRINHNITNEDCDKFFIETLELLCQQDNNIKFMFYNPILAYQYGDVIAQHTLCLNSYSLLEMFSNKLRSRFVLKNIADIIPYIVLKGDECDYNNLCNYFVEYDEFVIQKIVSSGGEGTFHVNKFSSFDFIEADEKYLISPYIRDCISLNTHIVVFDDDILYFQPSIQIITESEHRLLYCGADYICYRSISESIKAEIMRKIEHIGQFVKQKGYRGILGIDFIVKAQQVYFIEFNTRFQASSQLVNKALLEHYDTSLQEINLSAFEHTVMPKIESFNIDYSNYIYTTDNISTVRLKKIFSSKEVLQIQTDGYNIKKDTPKGKNVYLSRCVFNRNICSLNNGKVVLHPNIYTEDIKTFISSDNPNYKEYVKIALLNHGVTLGISALNLSAKYGKIRDAVFDAIDAIIFDKVYVNIPYNCKFNTLSPFTIEATNNKFVLLYEGDKISDINIYFVPNALIDKYTSSGVPYDAIINLATDRIRINPSPICHYKRCGLSCKFCNLPDHNVSYNLTDIKEVIDYCLFNVEFRHFLIGGGTYSLDEKGWDIIIEIAQYIRKRCDKDIYLMSIPPQNNYILNMLKCAGITEVAFNIEMFDREMAKKYMPGKGIISIKQYMSALLHAVSLWGNTGNVRSLLIYGFDTDDNFVKGIEHLCKLGIEPIISVFRPLDGTEVSELNPPSTVDIISTYKKCQKIVKKHSMILGPNCPMCQNNTLSFTEL